MGRTWEVKKIKRTEPYRFLVVLLADNGNHEPCGHERYQTEQQALARAKYFASSGRRCDVLVDVAASYGKD